ncbi:MAG: GDP-mannose 4,6-dehydratase [Spirochaetes bacterium]|nr:GDP-mannose 4,6-dehydratase [Spirochaetota bacterium]
MEKYLITGFSGFVSRFFLIYLEQNKINANVLGVDINEPNINDVSFKYVKWKFNKINLLEMEKIENVIYQFNPNYILHLASFSSVGFSWKEPVISFKNNTNIFLNLLEAVKRLKLDCRILSIGSSEQYGNYNKKYMPLKEKYKLIPLSPYAVARVSQELLSNVYVNGYGLDIVMTRSFNHIGAYQKDIFVIPSFAKQLMSIIKSKKKSGELITGDTNITRDFLDVRDVASAYYLLFKEGKRGEVYNVCSGNGYILSDIINKMADICNININIKSNPKFIRPNDNKIIVGSNEKIKKGTRWNPSISIEQSLKDILEYWKKA